MLELRILVDNIDYDSIAEYLIPVVAEKLRREDKEARVLTSLSSWAATSLSSLQPVAFLQISPHSATLTR